MKISSHDASSPCFLTFRNPPVLQVKKLESWRTGWILVSTLANQDMSSEYSLKIWFKLAHCGLSYSCFYLSFALFSAGGGLILPLGGPILARLGGNWGDGFWKKFFQIHNQNFINFLAIYCTFLYKIWGSDDFGVAHCVKLWHLCLTPTHLDICPKFLCKRN